MRTRARRSLTYANVVSTLCLFLLLGGVATAAVTLSRNNVRGVHIAPNAVTSPKVRNGSLVGADLAANAITGLKVRNRSLGGADLANDTVTGAQVAEASLGAVPTATTAGTATSATSAITATRLDGLVPFSANVQAVVPAAANQVAARAAAPETRLYQRGPFELYAKCYLNGGLLYGDVFIRSTLDGSVYRGPVADKAGGNAAGDFLNPATPEPERRLNETSVGAADGEYVPPATFGAAAVDGTRIDGTLSLAIKQGPLAGGDGVYGAGSSCMAWGRVLTVS